MISIFRVTQLRTKMFMRKLTQKRKSLSRVLSPIALALLLTACGTSSVNRQNTLYNITAPVLQSSSFYLQKAETATDAETQANWYLLALKALIKEKQYERASSLVVQLSRISLTPLQLSEWQLNRAVLLEKKDSVSAAYKSLNFSNQWQLPDVQYERYYTLKARYAEDLEELPNAAISLIKLSRYLPTSMLKENANQVWQLLSQMPERELVQLESYSDQYVSAWAELAISIRDYLGLPEQQQQILDAWILRNTDHPASQYLPDVLTSIQSLTMINPERVAVLLPLTNKYANQGEAIRNGLIQASYQDITPPSLTFYDTNAETMQTIIRQLQEDRIDFVIGPLQKNKVDEFLRLNNNRIPVLAMNTSTLASNETNACFFTLSPEQEAEQAAERIFQDRLQYPLVLAPDNNYGHRIAAAFSQKWASLSANLVSSEFYKNRADMQNTTQRAFGLQASQERAQMLNRTIGTQVETDFRSRRDIDAVYLIAGSDELTLLKPFIEVSINPEASMPKLYSSSRSNNRAKGIGEIGELNGIEFSDIPMLIETSNDVAQEFRLLQPDSTNDTARLYALGADAYALIDALPQMRASQDYHYAGQSGELTLLPRCTIHRELSWAKFTPSGITPID